MELAAHLVMRLLAVVGILALSAATAGAAFLVELSGGEQHVVESYWEEGDLLHLQRGDVNLIYPKNRLVSVTPTDDPAPSAVPAARPSATPDSPTGGVERVEPPTREELEERRNRVEKHLLRVQAERFEARARGDDEKALKRLDREFRRTQERRGEVVRDIQALGQ